MLKMLSTTMNRAPRTGKSPAKFGFECVEIEMRGNNTLALCEANAIDQAGMVRAVRKNGVFGTENGAQQSDIRRISRSEIQRGFGANPRAKSFSTAVQTSSLPDNKREPVDATRDEESNASRIACFMRGRWRGQIVVGTEIDTVNCFEMDVAAPGILNPQLGEMRLFHLHGGGFNEAQWFETQRFGAWLRRLGFRIPVCEQFSPMKANSRQPQNKARPLARQRPASRAQSHHGGGIRIRAVAMVLTK